MKEKVFIGGRWQAGGGKRKVENDSTFHLALPANVSRVMIEKKAVRHVIGFSLENGSDRPRAAAWLNKKFFSKKSKIMEMMIQHALS